MKQVLGCIRRADQDFSMIQPGDRVAVGVSGGKDSLLLLRAMAMYRKFSPNPFELTAITVSMGLEPFDLSGVQAMCDDLEVPYVVKQTQIGDIVFNQRKEKNPCALCAKMRKGCLADTCVELGINKLALGHHRDDALETLLLSMFYEGRMHTFHPVTHLERTGITQIRPMVYLSEKQAVSAVRRLNLPVVESPCPVNGATRREDMKHILDDICKRIPKAREQMLSALMNHEKYELWAPGKGVSGDED
ncbi:MAG: tRNA 2-thiocytidine biosynthesis protein TtcA [Clostridia bacterium]|nr:tRNA 2-thiocytidine biosynthesis protein TtcA [Clostridia bacterium]